MNSIYFNLHKEAAYFCDKLFRLKKKIKIQWKKDAHWGNQLQLSEQQYDLNEIVSCLKDVFIHFRLRKLIQQMIEQTYFYKDSEEIERISVLTYWVLSEQQYAATIFGEYNSFDEYIITLFKKNLTINQPIYFDSLATFNLKPLHTSLIQAVGLAIDELKREEDHQRFIQSVREFIEHQRIKTKELHILQGEQFSFFKENGQPYTEIELKTLMYKEPLYIVGLDENEMNLSPIITLSPRNIYIYGDDPSEAKTLTIINLFQERVHFFPKNEFPFALY